MTMKKKDGKSKHPSRRLVLVDHAQHGYAEALTSAGYEVAGAASMKEALAFRPRPDGLIVELLVPNGELSQLASAGKRRRRLRAMTVSALAEAPLREEILKAGLAFCFAPCPPEELVEIVKRVLPVAA